MKEVVLITWIISLVCLVQLTSAQPMTGEKWEVIDIPFDSKEVPDDPFSVRFGAVFTHENGFEKEVPGFYNDNNQWIVRVSPSLEGSWTYKTYSTHSDLSSLEGSVSVGPNTRPKRHGPVGIDPNNPQRFMHRDGTPHFSMGFEIDWLFALDADNPDDIPRTRQILGHISDNNFNKVVINVFAYDARWGEKDKIDPRFNFANPDKFPFGGTNEDPDHSTLNIDFFKRFDRIMDELYDREIIAHLMIYVWNKLVNWPKPGSPEDNRYFDYVVKRYQAYPNLMWDISKEALAYGMDDMHYITDRIERLRELDGHKRLLTVHDYSYCKTFPDKVDFISIQEWNPNLYNRMREVAEEFPNKPIYNVEHGCYEETMHTIFHGAYVDALACLERTYLCFFAGVYNAYYWQNASWYEVVYEPFTLPEENQPRFGYYKHLVDLFNKYNFNDLEPMMLFYSTFILGNNKDTYLFYLPKGMISVEGFCPEPLRGKKTTFTWFNPLTGEYSEPRERTFGEWTGIRKPESITSPMAILILELAE